MDYYFIINKQEDMGKIGASLIEVKDLTFFQLKLFIDFPLNSKVI